MCSGELQTAELHNEFTTQRHSTSKHSSGQSLKTNQYAVSEVHLWLTMGKSTCLGGLKWLAVR